MAHQTRVQINAEKCKQVSEYLRREIGASVVVGKTVTGPGHCSYHTSWSWPEGWDANQKGNEGFSLLASGFLMLISQCPGLSLQHAFDAFMRRVEEMEALHGTNLVAQAGFDLKGGQEDEKDEPSSSSGPDLVGA